LAFDLKINICGDCFERKGFGAGGRFCKGHFYLWV